MAFAVGVTDRDGAGAGSRQARARRVQGRRGRQRLALRRPRAVGHDAEQLVGRRAAHRHATCSTSCRRSTRTATSPSARTRASTTRRRRRPAADRRRRRADARSPDERLVRHERRRRRHGQRRAAGARHGDALDRRRSAGAVRRPRHRHRRRAAHRQPRRPRPARTRPSSSSTRPRRRSPSARRRQRRGRPERPNASSFSCTDAGIGVQSCTGASTLRHDRPRLPHVLGHGQGPARPHRARRPSPTGDQDHVAGAGCELRTRRNGQLQLLVRDAAGRDDLQRHRDAAHAGAGRLRPPRTRTARRCRRRSPGTYSFAVTLAGRRAATRPR